MKLSFTTAKDRVWFAVDRGTKYLATAPGPVQSAGYGLIRGILALAYVLPGSPLGRTAGAFSETIGKSSGKHLYHGFADRFILALKGMELLRLGQTDVIDDRLEIPYQARLDAILDGQTGAIMVMPHCHASILTVRALAARYPVLMLIREPAKESRAITQRPYYTHIGCDLFEVRRNSDALVARAVFKALRQGKIVVGIVDRIREAPPQDDPHRKSDDTVRALAFGQPGGFVGWPARFANRCEAPILPAMVEQTPDQMVLHLGEPITEGDVLARTQSWATAVTRFCAAFPCDWGFVYDKHWSRLLVNSAQDKTGS